MGTLEVDGGAETLPPVAAPPECKRMSDGEGANGEGGGRDLGFGEKSIMHTCDLFCELTRSLVED